MTFTYPNKYQYIYPGGGGANVEIEYRTISAGEAAAKAINLSPAPTTPSEVIMGVEGGGIQVQPTDFVVSGSTLSWNGLNLDGILTAGDRIYVLYNSN